MNTFITLPIRMTRQDPNKPDKQISDFEEVLVNLDHIQFVHQGMSEDTCLIMFPGNVKQMAKGSLSDIQKKIKDALDPKPYLKSVGKSKDHH